MIDSPEGVEIQDYKTFDEVVAPEVAKIKMKIHAYVLGFLGMKVFSGGVAYI